VSQRASSRIPRVLSIAGSDSGGGAGIQADLKAFAACRVHGMTAITAITAQNTLGVIAVQAIRPDVIVAQVRAVAEDIGVDAVKIGMLGTVETIDAVATALDLLPPDTPIVLDPVMVSESGAALLEPDARLALVEQLLPRVLAVTPNVPEARALAGRGVAAPSAWATRHRGEAQPGSGPPDPVSPANPANPADPADAPKAANPPNPPDDAIQLAREVHALGPRIVIVTGGHRDAAIDVFFDGRQVVEIPGPRHPGGAAHGSGCTHSSVLAARLAWGDPPLDAAREAKRRAAQAVAQGLVEIGAGAGPVDVLGLMNPAADPA
jgi:hydroxymethylpyrimidine/phosphomethylpyrimidine kinase